MKTQLVERENLENFARRPVIVFLFVDVRF